MDYLSRLCMMYFAMFLLINTSVYALNQEKDKKQCLLKAYSPYISQKGQSIITKDGNKLVWDDGRSKSFNEKINHPDLQDTLSIPYPTFRKIKIQPSHNEDPGRFRNIQLLKSVYGNNKQNIRKNLVSIDWLSYSSVKKVKFNKNNGAAKALSEVIKELERLPWSYHKYFSEIGGTYRYRNISSTNRLSPHSFGIAIDLNVRHANYWRFNKNNLVNQKITYKNSIPQAIVDIFDRHCFIWGGRWYHYDTMHFEYRPELFCNKCI